MNGKDIKKAPQFFALNNPVKYKMPVHLNDDEMIRHVWDIEQVRELMNIRSYFIANEMRLQELEQLWVQEPEHKMSASFGANWGFFVGMDAIKSFYVDAHNAKRQKQLDAYCEKHPGFENKPENKGAGCINMHPMSTSIVRIAGDGKTAKGIWYCIGQDTEYNEDGGAAALWMNDKVCADFVREGGGWKLWHLVISNDMNYGAGKAYDAPTYMEPGTDPAEIAFGKPTIPMLAHDSTYNWSDNWPPMPEPYETLMPQNSYGPEGHPKYQGGEKA